MHAKNNRLNSDFQILHFLVGSCHTPDGAYALLCDLKANREDALSLAKANDFRQRAIKARAYKKKESTDEAERLEGEAELAEIAATAQTLQKDIAGAEAELAFINTCIDRLKTHRKYAHLPDPEAHQMSQRAEWLGELLFRAENFLLSMGFVPSDHLATMRQHPDFSSTILPRINGIKAMLLQNPEGVRGQMPRLQNSPALMRILDLSSEQHHEEKEHR